MIRFLHGADFHLDSAFGALPPGQAAARRRESRELALRLADYVKEHGIDLVLLAGDLFDSASPFRETGEQLAAALGQMRTRVFISPGNHDWYGPGSPWETVDWPENVYVFKENRLTAVEVPERNLVIHGAAFSGPEQLESLLAGFTAPADGKCHIGLLHGELDGAEARYGPIRREEAAASGLCYLALGHVHKRTAPLTLGRTVCAWPGCPEGRGFDELGEKGFLFGEVGPNGADMAFVPFARRHYQILRADVTDAAPLDAVERLLPLRTQEDIYRIILTGERTEDFSLTALQSCLEDRFFQLELRDETRAPEDLWARCGEDSLRGLFLQEMHRQLESAAPEDRAAIEQAVRFGLAAMDHRDL